MCCVVIECHNCTDMCPPSVNAFSFPSTVCLIQTWMAIANATPKFFKPEWKTSTQHSGIWIAFVKHELMSREMIILCIR